MSIEVDDDSIGALVEWIKSIGSYSRLYIYDAIGRHLQIMDNGLNLFPMKAQALWQCRWPCPKCGMVNCHSFVGKRTLSDQYKKFL